MNKDKLQIGDLVTLTREHRVGRGVVGLVVATVAWDARVVRVYWFKLRRAEPEWLSYLTKLEAK